MVTHAEIAALLADLGARIEQGGIPPTEMGWPSTRIVLDEVTAWELRDRITAALVALGEGYTRHPVEIVAAGPGVPGYGALTIEGLPQLGEVPLGPAVLLVPLGGAR